MEFLNKSYFWLLLLIPVIIVLTWISYKKSAIYFKFIEDLNRVFKYWKIKLFIKLALLSLIFAVFVLILANPNKSNIEQNISKNWIDIVLTLDVSESMNAEDLKPTRIAAAKTMINQFLGKLKTDRVWLVIFAWKPFTSLPLTFDYDVVKQTIDDINTKTINQNNPDLNGTAIWDALLMAKNLFKNDKKAKTRQKVIILLTDGDANKWVDPILAAEYLKKYGIKVYTIWIGSPNGGYISYQVWPFTQHAKIPPLKADTLIKIAKITWWKFFRATDNQTLKNIFDEIAKLTKTKIDMKVKKTYTPYYTPFIAVLLVLMVLYIYMRFKEV